MVRPSEKAFIYEFCFTCKKIKLRIEGRSGKGAQLTILLKQNCSKIAEFSHTGLFLAGEHWFVFSSCWFALCFLEKQAKNVVG